MPRTTPVAGGPEVFGESAASLDPAVLFARRIHELLHDALDLRDRYLDGQLSRHGLDVCRGRLNTQLLDAIYPIKTNAANETLAQHLWNHRDDLLTFLKHPGLDATNWRANWQFASASSCAKPGAATAHGSAPVPKRS